MARKNALLDVVKDAYVRGMARNVNALAEIAGKPFPDPRVYARGAEFVPGVGDAVGLGQDVRGYVENPNSLTPWAGLWSLAALAPGVPSANQMKLADLPRDMREELFNLHAMYVNPSARQSSFLAKLVKRGELPIKDIRGLDEIPAAQLAGYEQAFGIPVVIANGKLIDGQHRIRAAQKSGKESLPVIDLTGLIDPDASGFITSLD